MPRIGSLICPTIIFRSATYLMSCGNVRSGSRSAAPSMSCGGGPSRRSAACSDLGLHNCRCIEGELTEWLLDGTCVWSHVVPSNDF